MAAVTTPSETPLVWSSISSVLDPRLRCKMETAAMWQRWSFVERRSCLGAFTRRGATRGINNTIRQYCPDDPFAALGALALVLGGFSEAGAGGGATAGTTLATGATNGGRTRRGRRRRRIGGDIVDATAGLLMTTADGGGGDSVLERCLWLSSAWVPETSAAASARRQPLPLLSTGATSHSSSSSEWARQDASNARRAVIVKNAATAVFVRFGQHVETAWREKQLMDLIAVDGSSEHDANLSFRSSSSSSCASSSGRGNSKGSAKCGGKSGGVNCFGVGSGNGIPGSGSSPLEATEVKEVSGEAGEKEEGGGGEGDLGNEFDSTSATPQSKRAKKRAKEKKRKQARVEQREREREEARLVDEQEREQHRRSQAEHRRITLERKKKEACRKIATAVVCAAMVSGAARAVQRMAPTGATPKTTWKKKNMKNKKYKGANMMKKTGRCYAEEERVNKRESGLGERPHSNSGTDDREEDGGGGSGDGGGRSDLSLSPAVSTSTLTSTTGAAPGKGRVRFQYDYRCRWLWCVYISYLYF